MASNINRAFKALRTYRRRKGWYDTRRQLKKLAQQYPNFHRFVTRGDELIDTLQNPYWRNNL